LPVTLPRFLTVAATMKKARSGRITHMSSGPGAFHEFELRYPSETRSMILTHAGQMIAGSDREFYSTFLINIDWPPNYGRNALLQAAQAFPRW
jgi:hypothetical protein